MKLISSKLSVSINIEILKCLFTCNILAGFVVEVTIKSIHFRSKCASFLRTHA